MAPVCLSSMTLQSKQPSQAASEPLVKRSRKGSVSLDAWVCPPAITSQKEVSSPASSTSSEFSFGGSSCTTQKDSSSPGLKKTLTLDVSEVEEDEEVVSRESAACETPKSKKHRIPDVDVDLCPPAPKKARCTRSGRFTCSNGRSNFLQKLSFSPGYLF